MTEHDLQVAVVDWARRMAWRWPCLRWLHSSLNGASFEHRQVQVRGRQVDKAVLQWKRLEAEGATKGICDLFLPWAARGYHGFYIELKRPGALSQVRDGQREFMAYLEGAGYLAQVIDGVEDAIAALEWYLGGRDE